MTQIDELLRQTGNAVKRDDEAERRAIGRAQRALSAAITAEAAQDLPQPRRKGRSWGTPLQRRRTGLGLTLAGIAAAAAAAAAAVAVLAPGGSNVIRPAPAAAAILRRAANAVLAAPPAQLQSGQYWYEEAQATYLDVIVGHGGTMSAYVSEDQRWWVNAQHYVRREQLEHVRAAQPITDAWQRAALTQFRANPDINGNGPGYDLPVSYTRMLQAPSDPTALADFILHDYGTVPADQTPQQRAADLFLQIHDIVTEPRVPAQMLAGVYRLAATLEGVHVIGTVTDTLGRPALAIGFTDADQQTTYELLFDPQTYALLDERDTDSVTGRLVENVAYISTGTVAQIGATPPQQTTTQQQPTTITTPASTTTTPTSTSTTPTTQSG